MKGPRGLRLVYLIDSLGWGGAERLLLPLLCRLQQRGVWLRLCALQVRQGNPVQAELQASGVPVDVLGVARLRQPLNLPRLAAYLRRHRPHVLHTQLEFANTLGTLAGRWLRLPVTNTLHTLDRPAPGSRAARRLRLMWWVLRWGSARVIAVSEETRQHALHQGRLPADRVVTLYNGLELSRFCRLPPPERRAPRLALGLEQEALLFVTVAVLRQAKGIQTMLQALPAIKAALPATRYLVVGDGPYRAELERRVKEAALSSTVTFTGMRPDVAHLLSLSDIFVLPTLDDALPTVLIEAMGSRLPIVASAVGGVPEMVEEGGNGLLVPPGDAGSLAAACIRLGRQPAQARQMGEAGHALAEGRFDLERQVDGLLALYTTLAAREES